MVTTVLIWLLIVVATGLALAECAAVFLPFTFGNRPATTIYFVHGAAVGVAAYLIAFAIS